MDHPVIHAKHRTAIGKVVDHLRREKLIPAVVYGHDVTSQPIELNAADFLKLYKTAGQSSLVDLVVDDKKPVAVLIHDVQRHPTRQTLTHVDFYQVKMTEKIEAEIELEFVGESSAVKESGGVFIRTLDKLKVSCLPGDLVPSIQVDIAVLKTFEDRIHVNDLKLPKGLTSLVNGDEVVASVTAPRSEAEIEALSGEVKEDVTAVEVEKKGKVEEEGEAAEPTDKAADKKPADKKTTDK